MKQGVINVTNGAGGTRPRRLDRRRKEKYLAGAAGIAAGVSIFASSQVLAADNPSIAELQAENARLRQQLQQLQNQVQGEPQSVAPSPAVAAAPAVPTPAARVTEAPVETLDQIVVRARDKAEKLQDVPIPVSAVGGQTLERNNAVTVQDFAKLTPNLLVHVPNARQTSISIRGVGKNTANDALEPSVGVIIDGIPSGYIAQSWGDFSDLDHVEVLRGPQGTLLGKNTTLGVVNVVTKPPSFTPESSVELYAGDHRAIGSKASIGGPIQEGVLAYRASAFAEKREGPFENIAPQRTNETLQERNRFGGRLQFLVLPSDDLSIRLSADRQESAELIPWGEPPLIGDPATFPNGAVRPITRSSRLARSYFGGYRPIIGNWDVVDNNGSRPTRSESNGVSAQVDWTPTQGSTFTSITAYRDSLFDAKNDGDWTRFDIQSINGAVIKQNQISQEFRYHATLGDSIDYTAGLYYLNSRVDSTDRSQYGIDAGAFYATNAQYNTLVANPVGRLLMQDSLRGLYVFTPTSPNTRSLAEFGQANWHITDQATLTLGLRRTHENKDNRYSKFTYTDSVLEGNIASGVYAGATAAQLAAARAIRAGQLGTQGSVTGDEINATSYAWLINPSYKLNDNTLLYTSVGYGEKSGSVQFNTTTLTQQNVDPEKALDFELGIKSAFFDRALILNANLYQTQINDYQQNLTVTDATQASGFRTFLGNVKEVTLRGLEADGTYAFNSRLRFNFGGAYNRAFYSDFKNSPCPGDISAQPGGAQQCDFTGKQLPYAPKFSGNIGFDYRGPLFGNYYLHAYANSAYRSRANYNAGLSDVGKWGGYSLLDGGIGVQTADGKLEVALVGKNLADTQYVTNISTFSATGATTATPGERRYVGVVLRAKQF